jgi:hypothetical protein
MKSCCAFSLVIFKTIFHAAIQSTENTHIPKLSRCFKVPEIPLSTVQFVFEPAELQLRANAAKRTECKYKLKAAPVAEVCSLFDLISFQPSGEYFFFANCSSDILGLPERVFASAEIKRRVNTNTKGNRDEIFTVSGF